jgi:hypothetical protein
VDVARWRRPGADEILLAYLLLAAAGWTVSWLSHAYSPRQNPFEAFPGTVFLTWRVSRGGRISRALLVLYSVASLAATVLLVARMRDAGRGPGPGLPAALADRRPGRAADLPGRAAAGRRAVGACLHVGPVPGLLLADGPGPRAGARVPR